MESKKSGSIAIVIILTSIAAIASSTRNNQTEVLQIEVEKRKPVKTLKLEEQTQSTYLKYIGTVNSNDIRKLGFKSNGKLKKVNVKKGQKISKGTTLATIGLDELSYSIEGARAQLDSASAQYDKAVNDASLEEINRASIDIQKAEDAYNYSLDNYERYKKLVEEEVIPSQSVEQAKFIRQCSITIRYRWICSRSIK